MLELKDFSCQRVKNQFEVKITVLNGDLRSITELGASYYLATWRALKQIVPMDRLLSLCDSPALASKDDGGGNQEEHFARRFCESAIIALNKQE